MPLITHITMVSLDFRSFYVLGKYKLSSPSDSTEWSAQQLNPIVRWGKWKSSLLEFSETEMNGMRSIRCLDSLIGLGGNMQIIPPTPRNDQGNKTIRWKEWKSSLLEFSETETNGMRNIRCVDSLYGLGGNMQIIPPTPLFKYLIIKFLYK